MNMLVRLEPLSSLENSSNKPWEEGIERVLSEGVPIRFKLEKENLVISFRVIPYFQQHRSLMILQVDARRKNERGEFVAIMSTIQTIPMELDVPVLFYPFGKTGGSHALALEFYVTR